MKLAIVLVGLALVVGCGESAELKRARAKYFGLDQALRQAQIAEIQAQIDENAALAEAEHNRCRDLEGQLLVAQLEFVTAGGDPNVLAALEAQVAKELGTDEKLKQIQANVDRAAKKFEEEVERINANSVGNGK